MPRPKQLTLTDRRRQWVSHRTTNLNGENLNHDIVLQDRYQRMLEGMVRSMTKEYHREIIKFLRMPEWKAEFTTDSSISSQANILFNHLEAKFRRMFKTLGNQYAQSIIKDVNIHSRIATGKSLSKLAGGLTISTDFITDRMQDQMKAFRYENQQLALNLEQRYSNNIRVEVLESIRHPQPDGIRGLIATIEKNMLHQDGIVTRRAKNIAHDQIRRAYNNLNSGRMQAVGVNEFKWIHSRGGRYPRHYHMNVLHGQIFSFDDPPVIDEKTGERGIPGQIIGCKCTFSPVISFDEGDRVSRFEP